MPNDTNRPPPPAPSLVLQASDGSRMALSLAEAAGVEEIFFTQRAWVVARQMLLVTPLPAFLAFIRRTPELHPMGEAAGALFLAMTSDLSEDKRAQMCAFWNEHLANGIMSVCNPHVMLSAPLTKGPS